MKNLLSAILLTSLVALGNLTNAQISEGGSPLSFSLKNSSPLLPASQYTNVLPKLDLNAVQLEDIISDQHKDIPWRFGVAHTVDLGLSKGGSWQTTSNGDRIWTLKVQSKGALSLNINYDDFFLPNGAKLFVYNEDKSDIIGAFTSRNNKTSQNFATRPVKGETSIIEYYEPAAVKGQGRIHINQVVHGYRSIFDKAKSFGDAGSCNINVNCSVADQWQDEKRSVVLILTSNNTRWCTGALVNNVRQDSTSYILTAAHCNLANNSIFVFGYESSTCSPSTDGFLNKSVTGATRRANYSPSDVTLFELSSNPPASYQVYYSGWSNLNSPSLASTAIHHPRGDVMKFSQDYDPATTTGYYATGNDHWQVADWDLGTTEPTSSGSPLYDQNHRIVGQLHGGDAACGNDDQDYYGKFSYSWNTSSNPAQQLKAWLDPDNTGTTTLDGLDMKPAAFNRDAEFLSVAGLSTYNCDSIFSPVLVVRNKGSQAISQLGVQYSYNGTSFTNLTWNAGNLNRNGVDTIQLPQVQLSSGLYNFRAIVSGVNGSTDQNISNDSIALDFRVNADPIMVNYTIKTDNYGSETTWSIQDQTTGSIVANGGPYTNVSGGQVFTQQLCLYDTCFNHTIFDSFGDGFNHPTNGNGYVLITQVSNGDTLLFENNFSGTSKTGSFCPSVIVGIDEANSLADQLRVYPNPTNTGSFFIDLIDNRQAINQVILFDVRGNEVMSWRQQSKQYQLPSALAQGMYFLRIVDETGNYYSKKLMIQR